MSIAVEAPTRKNYAIDAARVEGRTESTRDPDATDAIWVPIVSPDREECNSPEALRDAERYVVEMGLGSTSGIDKRFGPHLDGGQRAPIFQPGGPADQGIMSAREYLNMAARGKMSAAGGEAKQYISFFRVRRADLIG